MKAVRRHIVNFNLFCCTLIRVSFSHTVIYLSGRHLFLGHRCIGSVSMSCSLFSHVRYLFHVDVCNVITCFLFNRYNRLLPVSCSQMCHVCTCFMLTCVVLLSVISSQVLHVNTCFTLTCVMCLPVSCSQVCAVDAITFPVNICVKLACFSRVSTEVYQSKFQ